MSLRKILISIGLVAAWGLIVAGAVAAEAFWFSAPAVTRGDARSIEQHMVGRIRAAVDEGRIGAAGLVLVDHGQIVAKHGFGIADAETKKPVSTEETLFRTASVSKAVTAWGIMKMVQDGKIGLDEPIFPRLKRWRFPGSEPYREKVTIRQLLSHTGGLDDGLGYAGFLPGEPMQSVEDSLNFTKDSTVGEPRPVKIAWEPGTKMMYGSGGYTVLQLLVEEMTKEPFCEFMEQTLLEPLHMGRSTFDHHKLEATGRIKEIAPDFDADLKPQPHRRQVSQAGVGFYATVADLGRFIQAYSSENPVLKRETVAQMLEPQAATGGTWGLGQTLFTDNGDAGKIVGHDGGSPPAWGAWLRVNPTTGNGMAMTVSGGSGALNQLAHDWVYWETGKVTAEARLQKAQDRLVPAALVFLIGALAIVLWRFVRR